MKTTVEITYKYNLIMIQDIYEDMKIKMID